MRCTECDGKRFKKAITTRRIVIPVKVEGVGREVEVRASVPVMKCSSCGAEYEVGPISERRELLTSRVLIERGLSSGSVIRYARKALGMKAADLADLLGVRPETVSSWETDKTAIGHPGLVTLRDLVQDAIDGVQHTADQLRALRTPTTAHRLTVDVTVPDVVT